MSEKNFINKVEKDPEEQKILLLLLRTYAAATQKKLNVPSITYLDEISGILDWPRSKTKSWAGEYIKKYFKVSKFNLNQSVTLYLGMFNATMDTGRVINLNTIKNSVEATGFLQKSVNGITIKPVKFVMGYGRFKKTYEYTQEYGSKSINANKPSSYVQFLLKVKKGNKIQGASFNLYHTGRIRFSGGYLEGNEAEAKSLVQFISENYFPIDLRLPIQINNNTIEIKLGTSVRILGLYTLLNGAQAKFNGYTLSTTFEPERNKFITKQRKNSPFLYISFKKDNQDKFGLVISRTGTVMVEGAKDVAETWIVVRRFFNALKDSGLLEDPPARKKNLTITHKPSKLARRVNMKPAPEITRRGTGCPKDRRPKPYSFQGDCAHVGKDHYVRPNPQGQPCCYKKPKSIQYMRNRLENRYNRANVKVPNAVRKTFGFGGNTNQKANNIGRTSLNNLAITFNKTTGKNKQNPVGLKIGSRQCSRYSKVALVDIAKRKGLLLPKKITKPILCDLLSKLVNKSPSPKRRSRTPSPASVASSRANSNYNNMMAFMNNLGTA
jgi:hypothetical protein